MFKFTTRIVPAATRALPRTPAARRFISTAPPHQKSRGWRNSAARWGLAGALVYYYNTASTFAEEPSYAGHAPPQTSRDTETYPTVASISEERKAQARLQSTYPSIEPHAATREVADGETTAPGSPEALEEEASEQGAFNEETGEINWDCPCLGGMAYGPCGEQFRAAFSCFVFSQEDPKGVDCIEHFKTMQNCFREHPELYGAELEDDEDGAADVIDGENVPAQSEPTPQANAARTEVQLVTKEEVSEPPASNVQASQSPRPSQADPPAVEKTRSNVEGSEPVPKAWHDSRDSPLAK